MIVIDSAYVCMPAVYFALKHNITHPEFSPMINELLMIHVTAVSSPTAAVNNMRRRGKAGSLQVFIEPASTMLLLR